MSNFECNGVNWWSANTSLYGIIKVCVLQGAISVHHKCHVERPRPIGHICGECFKITITEVH